MLVSSLRHFQRKVIFSERTAFGKGRNTPFTSHNEDRLMFYRGGKLVADVPASTLVLGGGAPVYDRKYKEHKAFAKCKRFDIHTVKDIDLQEAAKVARFLFAHPNIASKRWPRLNP